MARKKYVKEKKIEEAINTLVESFLSHIVYIYTPHEDGKKFHFETAKEYLRAIEGLVDTLYN